MAGIVGTYSLVPRLTQYTVAFQSPSDGVSNPADSEALKIPNIRGQLSISIFQGDNPPGVSSSFGITGGFGQWPCDATRNWYGSPQGSNCSVVETSLNTFEVTTATPAIVRKYRFIFFYTTNEGPTVKQISVNLLGTNDLTVTLSKMYNIEGF